MRGQYIIKQDGVEWHIAKKETDQFQTFYDVKKVVDKNNNLFVFTERISGIDEREQILYKYNKNSKVAGYAVLQKSYMSYSITQDGDVYLMTFEDELFKIYELILGNSDQSKFGEI